ncbi:hypothetical protein AK812_SmicGene28960 [Symbiodinium microadriaticum]|uniref:Uncharacterized protein n=1 Tax=Symbiodinium microadriaticum TaxID=2951 RepID=A0A1Q9D318_SYMMI|nr:hypothetical protein AK812_SmicGene28960 [Symbiodinium microadriaticum]CAE7841172.1 unnamed protein product [Symbiodinium microadriaticum]CAE7938973.1 unnamed protein product [Symbiodinium sp. KB8]
MTSTKNKQVFDIVLPAVEKAVGNLESMYAGLARPLQHATHHPAGRLAALLGQAEHLTKAGISKAILPVQDRSSFDFAGEQSMQLQESTIHASSLRNRLADFACLAPVEDPGSPDNSAPSEFRTLQQLASWRDTVSCKEALSRKESMDILQVLIRAERAIAEMQRWEASCTRRWDALSQEVRQARNKIKTIRARAQKLKERQSEVDLAAGHRREELWTKLLEATGHGEGDMSTTAAALHKQLCQSDKQRRQLRDRISADTEKLHRVWSKRRQAQDTVDLLTQLARTDQNGDTGERHSADDIVDAELSLEALIWKQIREERARFAVPDPPQPPRLALPEVAEETQASESPSFAPVLPPSAEPDDLENPLVSPLVPSGPSFPSLPSLTKDAEDTALHVELKQTPASLPPKVANLIERLSMSRDARRQAERAHRSKPLDAPGRPAEPRVQTERPPVPACASEPDSFGPTFADEPPPPLPEPGRRDVQQGASQVPSWKPPPPPSHASPDMLWGELPSAPLELGRSAGQNALPQRSSSKRNSTSELAAPPAAGMPAVRRVTLELDD